MAPPDDDDDSALAARILRPARPRLADARAALGQVRELSEAWTVLATRDVIPMEWTTDAHRRFASPCGGCGGYGGYARSHYADTCNKCHGAGFTTTSDRPATLRGCVAFASDPAGVTTAEELARELLASIMPGARAPDAVIWRHVTPSRDFGGEAFRFALRGLRALLMHTAHPTGNALQAVERAGCSPYRPRPPAITAQDVTHALATVRAEAGPDTAPALALLCDLWRTGYTLDNVTSDAVVLLAPEPS